MGGNVTIRCWLHLKNMRIVLYKDGAGNYLTYTDPAGSEGEFPITRARREHGGSYTCRYSDRTGPATHSEPSDPVQIIVAAPTDAGSSPAGGTDSIQSEAAPTPTRQGSAVPGGSEPPGLTSPIIAGASAAAAVLLLLLLLMVFVCFKKTRARKGATSRPTSTSPMGALKPPAQQDSSYDSIDKGKQPQTLPQEPNPDGLTYAELNHQPLQAKPGDPAAAPQPAQPGVYAAINVSRGAPQ
ncbi:leukocyte immunoglobulin-like receptor subfamily B member 2 [Mauremys mutica]|uniref:leukocyte immunoglobulin-like receptor subfamily B member 2 n=1 Tax=Mauremys mutica TaxID=74926 RepID=UPI001D16530D|nr:leukocyte immunoglobulin-like receptor subfamily B member 2 [Mauremys mutica]